MTIDPQVQTALFGLLATAITVLGGWALAILERRLGIDKNDRATKVFETAISNGIALGAKVVATKVAAGVNVSDPSAEVAHEALAYAAPKVEGPMKQLNISPATLPERVKARVAKVLVPTPPGADQKAVTEALNAAQLETRP